MEVVVRVGVEDVCLNADSQENLAEQSNLCCCCYRPLATNQCEWPELRYGHSVPEPVEPKFAFHDLYCTTKFQTKT